MLVYSNMLLLCEHLWHIGLKCNQKMWQMCFCLFHLSSHLQVCSAYLGIHDNDRRLADHFGGKLHLGFIQIR